MQDTPVIRKYHTPGQREEILANYQRSGLTQREFTQREGICLSTLQRWLKQPFQPRPEANPPGFIPVANLLAQATVPACYRVRFTGGVILEVPSGFCARELQDLFQALKAL